jgi:signal transduction histidine kinase
VRWIRARLARTLFLSYLLVVLVGVVTLLIAAQAVAPTFFTHYMAQMMGAQGMGGMMGGLPAPVDARLDAAFRAALMQALLVAATAALVAALLLSLFVSRQITRPVQRMLRATRRIASGHYAERVPITPANAADEVGQLAASFNAMAGALEHTERRRLELIGDVAHELRTPIATLEGYLEGLLDGVVEPSPRTWAKLHDEAGRLRRLVDDLQDLSRAEARQIPLVLRSVAPAAIVQAALDRVGPQFAEKGLDLRRTIPPHLPSVQADRDRVVQVLTNLLTNALRYTPAPGRVEVTAERHGDAVAISVTDTGIGLAPDHLAHIFERFYRVETSRSRALGGSGVGLTIAKALVEAMGGQIQAHSAGLGNGSTFTVTLPIAH